MNRYLIIDGNNILHASNSMSKLTIGQTEVQAIFGFLRTIRRMVSVYATSVPIVLFDGASWRKMSYPEYKANREKSDTASSVKAKSASDSAKLQLPAIIKALSLLGVTQVRAFNMEADDMAAILTDRYVKRGDKITLVSGDKDWLQLVGSNVTWFDPIGDRKVSNVEDLKEKIGIDVADFKQFVEYKALCGDLGDNIPGVGGVGDKGAQEFLKQFGSFANFSNMCMTGTVDPATLPKKFRDLHDDEDKIIAFARNIKLMDLRTKSRPDPINLQVDRGEPNLAKFRALCERFMFKSFTKDLENWVSVFAAHADEFDKEKAA
ncbi:MAG: 5'-3' exonuclease H3TH domain-containing protein [Undibacterium sp.]